MKKYFGIVGMPGVGKSTALEIAGEYGEVFVMGDIVREETTHRGLEINSENLGKTAKDLRKEFGNEIIATRIMDKIRKSRSNIVIIDGIRSNYELELFRKEFEVNVIAIIAPDDIRHNWILARKRADDSQAMQDILGRDNREIGFGVKYVIENAEYKVENEGSILDLKEKCRKIFEELAK